MKILYECSIIFILLPLAACSPATAVTTQPISAPQATDTVVPPPTPAPTYTPAILTVDQKVEAYLNGGIDDVGDLNAEDLTQFSKNLVEKLSAQRGAAPNIYNNEAYLAPDTLKMRKVEDGTTAEQQTIEMFVSISKDAEGNLMYKGPDGEFVTVEDSTGFDWNAVITNSDDPRIELPTYEDNGVNVVARNLDHINPDTNEDDYALVPLIVDNKNLGQIYLEGADGREPKTKNILSLLKIETDEAGHPIYGRLVLGIQITSRIYTEGSDTFVGSSGMVREDFPFWNALQTDQIYYFMVDVDQEDAFKTKIFAELEENWTGFVPPPMAFYVLTGTEDNNKDLLLIDFCDVVAKK